MLKSRTDRNERRLLYYFHMKSKYVLSNNSDVEYIDKHKFQWLTHFNKWTEAVSKKLWSKLLECHTRLLKYSSILSNILKNRRMPSFFFIMRRFFIYSSSYSFIMWTSVPLYVHKRSISKFKYIMYQQFLFNCGLNWQTEKLLCSWCFFL